jgi:hypothetical protein
MKKIIGFFLLLISIQFANAQTEFERAKDCPPGYIPVLNFNIEQFNFHKPRTNCTSGFGLCIRIKVESGCQAIGSFFAKTSLVGNIVTAWGTIQNGKLSLHIPAGLKKIKGFTESDFKTFTIDDAAILQVTNSKVPLYLTPGNYPVTTDKEDLVVTIPLQN